ncbi:G-protein coupled receptor GRL101-like [Oscarella lobularis]|uniref:G-protein coupled receptor GRL101-like n=1 Tax=Oscarella lobularis TaxID=121494 RepID=UPI003313DA98
MRLCKQATSTTTKTTIDATLKQGNVVWIILSVLIIAGNLTVIIWRCRAKREQRNSIPSILVINLAAADFFLGIQIFLYVLLYSNWLCFVWNNKALMSSLCIICGFFETTCIYVSGMINATIALYYAVVMFERCCCVRRLSRTQVLVLLCIQWIISIAVAISAVSVNAFVYFNTTNQFPSTPGSMLIYEANTATCVPLNFIFSQLIFNKFWENTTAEVVANVGTIIFSFLCLLMVATVGTYLAILIKLLRLRVSSTLPPSLSTSQSTSTRSLSFRLATIAVITLFGWTLYFIFLSVFPGAEFGQMLPYGFVALSNPVTFTLLSRPFLNALRKFKEKVLFKIGRAVPIEDMASDNESLIPTRALPSISQENY